jgi:dihydrofolate synthase / folylpolyglutamate synthase
VTYESAVAYLEGTINERGSSRQPHRLERMRVFLRELGDPQERYPTIHVGGTSGKGSTSSMIAAALSASGKRIGLHTKPHLQDVTERARVGGVPIPKDQLGAFLSEILPAIEATALEYGRPSYYETLLALAFVHFAVEKVDAAVIEVGLGGLLDGTNVLHPQVSVITNVGLDHTDVLGETIEEIAADKAGIAKPGIPLVTGTEDRGAREVIARHCEEIGAPFLYVGERVRVVAQSGERHEQSFTVETLAAAGAPVGKTYQIALPLLGRFQQKNAATAILALEQLEHDLRPRSEEVERGLAQLVIPGRMEFFPGHPGIVFDIAHNPDKAQHLADALLETFGNRRFTFVMAVAQDKDALGILAPFVGLNASFIFTEFDVSGRAATRAQRLAIIANEGGASARTITAPAEALSVARRNADASDIIVITGSTFLVAELRAWWISNVRVG